VEGLEAGHLARGEPQRAGGHVGGQVIGITGTREGRVYERTVFLVRPIGFVEPTAARRISYQDSLEFESLHEEAYRECGFEIVDVAATSVMDRADAVASTIASRA